MSDLLSCPFCGSAPIFPDAKDVFGTCYDAGCEDCGIPELSIQIIDCFDHPRGHVHESFNKKTFQYGVEYIEVARQYAIEQWNSRVKPTAGAQVSDEAAADFLRLAKFSDGWNSYNFEQFKEFRQREIDREAALALRSKE